jgi:hypothetical protein
LFVIFQKLGNNHQDTENANSHDTHSIARHDQVLKVLDYGTKYVSTAHLAIWLIKWSTKFHDVLMKATATAANSNKKNTNVTDIATSFWHHNNQTGGSLNILNTKANESQQHLMFVTLKLNDLNANTLVGCVFMANGNNLHGSALTLAPPISTTIKPQILMNKKQAVTTHVDIDDDLTQITNSSLSEPIIPTNTNNNNRNGLTSAQLDSQSSSTLDISSLTINELTQEQRQRRNRSRSKSPTKKAASKSPLRKLCDESLRLDAGKSDGNGNSSLATLEFYNVSNVRPQKVDLTTVMIPLSVESLRKPPLSQTLPVLPTNEDEDATRQKRSSSIGGGRRKSLGSSSLEFLTSIFSSAKSKSQSPARSKTPPPPPQTTLSSSSPMTNQPSSTLLKSLVNPPPPTTSHMSPLTMQDMIRDELKRIVQMQHDTVMSFLNGGAGGPPTNQVNWVILMNFKEDRR